MADAPQEKSFGARESRLRQTILKVVRAVSVMAASLLLFLVMPLFPRELMVLAAIGLGALAYKAPTVAVVGMMGLALPGYVYQLGAALPSSGYVPIPVIVIMSVILLATAALVGVAGGVLGITAGAIAAVLMFTPLHFLALPVIVGVILFRTKHVHVRAAGAILTFVLLYYPLLAITAGAAPGPLLIFGPVSLHAGAPVSVLSLQGVSSNLGQAVGTGGNAQPYLESLAKFWPLSFRQRLFPAGLLFGLLTGAAMATTGATLILFRWLKKRDMSHAHLAYAAPGSSLLAGIFMFMFLANLLARPLDFTVDLDIPMLLIGAAVVGGSGSVTELWLSGRNLVLGLRERLAERVNAMRTQTDFLTDRIRVTKAQCQRMDNEAEEALIRMCEQELTFVEQSVDDMPLNDLEQKVVLFQQLQDKLQIAVQESNAKLYQYYDEDRERYNDQLRLAKGYGFSLGEPVEGPNFSQLTTMPYDEVLEVQTSLNARCGISARSLAESIERLENRLCSEVDPGFKRTGIRIARDYFTNERYSEALQEFLLELGDIEYVLLTTVADLDKEIVSVLDSLKPVISDVLMPTAVNLGDAASVAHYREVMGVVRNLQEPPAENTHLPDLMRTVSRVGQLAELIATLSSRLGERMVALEESIQSKTPSGYNWGFDPGVRERVTEVSRSVGKPSGPMGIHDRVSLLKSAPPVIELAAHAVKNYSVTHELLVNYANVEYLIEEKLREAGEVSGDNLPVTRKYSRHYLDLYRLKHPREVYIEDDTGRLRRLSEVEAGGKITQRR